MDDKRINSYVLFLLTRQGRARNEEEERFQEYSDNWRRNFVQIFLLKTEQPEIYNILSQMYKHNDLLMKDFKIKDWHSSDESVLQFAIPEVQKTLDTPLICVHVAQFLRILYFPEFILANNNMDFENAVQEFKKVHKPFGEERVTTKKHHYS